MIHDHNHDSLVIKISQLSQLIIILL